MSALSQLFDDHIRIQRQRTDEAMAVCKVDTLAIHAGSPHMLFLDDHPYPFKPNPHFKLWVPLEDAVDCWLLYRPEEQPLPSSRTQPTTATARLRRESFLCS